MVKWSIIIISSILLLALIGVPSSTDKEYNVHIPNFNDVAFCENVICEGVGCASTNAQLQRDIELRNELIKVNYLNLNYNETIQKLTIEAEIDKTTGKTANFFHLILTDGDLDVGRSNCEGSVGHLYVDFTDETRPKVNVFAFNGHLNLYCNNGESHQRLNVTHNGYDDTSPYNDGTGPYRNRASVETSFYAKFAPYYREEIYSSLQNPSYTTFSIDHTATAKIIRLELDVTRINSHQVVDWLLRNKSYTYEGIKFGERVGVWFWAAANAVPTYTSRYISSLLTNQTDCSTCVHPELETKSRVVCGASSVTSNPVEVGKPTTLNFQVFNIDYHDSVKAPVIINYQGLPDGAKPNIPNGDEIIFTDNGTDGVANVSIEWTPEADQLGTYNIGVNFLVEYGLNNLFTECATVNVTVGTDLPECKRADLSTITQADQEMAQLTFLAEKLEQRIIKTKNLLGEPPRVDSFNPSQENRIGWAAYNAIVGQGTYLFECKKIENCANGIQISTLDSELGTFKTAIDNLRKITVTRANKLKKALVRLYLKNGLTLNLARKRATRVVRNQFLQGKNNEGALPTYSSAMSFIDIHVNSYGLTRYSANDIASLEQACGLKVTN